MPEIIKPLLLELELDLEHDLTKFGKGFTYEEKIQLLLHHAADTGFAPEKSTTQTITIETGTTIFD